MKEAPRVTTVRCSKNTRQGATMAPSRAVHDRGDKVVVNGAKQSLLTILRRYICKCSHHSLDKLVLRFLNQNKIIASYDIIVWMFIFLKKNCRTEIFGAILKGYLEKMRTKFEEDQVHQSEKYIETKKSTITKFINSGEQLLNIYLDYQALDRSVEALYKKGKSKCNVMLKIQKYLTKMGFQSHLQFQETCCSVIAENLTQTLVQVLSFEPISSFLEESNLIESFSNNFEEEISQHPQQEKPQEENSDVVAEDKPNMSERPSPRFQSYDLFEELIYNDQSACSLHSNYLI